MSGSKPSQLSGIFSRLKESTSTITKNLADAGVRLVEGDKEANDAKADDGSQKAYIEKLEARVEALQNRYQRMTDERGDIIQFFTETGLTTPGEPTPSSRASTLQGLYPIGSITLDGLRARFVTMLREWGQDDMAAAIEAKISPDAPAALRTPSKAPSTPIAATPSKVDELQAELSKVKDENATLVAKSREIVDRYRKMLTEYKALQQTVGQDKEADNVKGADALPSGVEELQNCKEQLTALQQQVDSLHSKVKDYNAALEAAQSENKSLGADVDRFKQEVAKLRSAAAADQHRMNTILTYINSGMQALNDALEHR